MHLVSAWSSFVRKVTIAVASLSQAFQRCGSRFGEGEQNMWGFLVASVSYNILY